jgi:hypothetical protein
MFHLIDILDRSNFLFVQLLFPFFLFAPQFLSFLLIMHKTTLLSSFVAMPPHETKTNVF